MDIDPAELDELRALRDERAREHAQTQPEPDPVDELDSVEDFDAYWRDYGEHGTRVRFMGEVVTLPPSLPLRFQTEATRLQNSETLEDIGHLVSILLPDDEGVLDRWLAKGIDVKRLGIFVIYATSRIAGKGMTFAEAAEQYDRQLARKEAKQPTDRLPAGGGQSPT